MLARLMADEPEVTSFTNTTWARSSTTETVKPGTAEPPSQPRDPTPAWR